MKRMVISVTAVLLAMCLGCSEQSPVAVDDDLIVIRAYLYAGEPVADIQITETLPLGSEASTAPPVNDAVVVLKKNGRSYPLVPSAGDSGYYHYDGSDLVVEADDVFEIDVRHNDQHATAETSVPEAPENVAISGSELRFPDMQSIWELRQQGVSMDSIRQSMSLTVTWTQESGALYYVVVENIDPDPQPVERSGFGRPPGRFISRPMPGNRYIVNAMMMTHFGRHRVKVYRVNQEYADLYESRNQDSRDLNEPLSNVDGGLGVFSAFNSRSVEFNFVQ